MPTTTSAGLGWYLENIKGTPLLTALEEKQLSRRIREHCDPIAREQMIQANLRLVVNIAKQYTNPGMTLGDVVAEGNLGLMRAVEEFNPDAGVRFSTYAAWWIKQSIKRALINAGQPISIPAYMVKMISRWRQGSRELEAQTGRPPTVEEMAKKLHISRKKAYIIRDGLKAVNAPSQMSADSTQTMSEMLVDTGGEAPDQKMLDASDAPIAAALLEKLDERERKILMFRYGLDGYEGPQRTFKEIGKLVGLTRERVRQLEKLALAKLKEFAQDVL
ncbi:MAG: RNA polymerase sigma factor RpoD/SigA [Planctomycetota bacterium]|nr:RNA polymerase sigma factor RpoD/SigA [Planctomycetota bacterium]